MEEFKSFVDIVAKLRDPNSGCPWDLEQDHLTLRPYLIEEAYEVLDALDNGDHGELQKELGDLLLQIVLHSQIASESKNFTVVDVVNQISEKMVRRHPHVFGDKKVSGTKDVLKNWEEIKRLERPEKKGLLSGIPNSLPALTRAQRIGEKCAQVGFDWLSIEDVWKKVEEEMAEFKESLKEGRERQVDEFGDLLFSFAQLGRWLNLNSEDSLRSGCLNFQNRFNWMEENSDKPLKDKTSQELEQLWVKAKQEIESRKSTTDI